MQPTASVPQKTFHGVVPATDLKALFQLPLPVLESLLKVPAAPKLRGTPITCTALAPRTMDLRRPPGPVKVTKALATVVTDMHCFYVLWAWEATETAATRIGNTTLLLIAKLIKRRGA